MAVDSVVSDTESDFDGGLAGDFMYKGGRMSAFPFGSLLLMMPLQLGLLNENEQT